jgi:hypothetical protein
VCMNSLPPAFPPFLPSSLPPSFRWRLATAGTIPPLTRRAPVWQPSRQGGREGGRNEGKEGGRE